MRTILETAISITLAVALVAVTDIAGAQMYPTKPIRFVVPYAPGGNTDILARLIGQKLSQAWGQPVIPDNRPGAGGTVGAELVAGAPSDGYTIIMGSFGNMIVANSLYKRLTYHPLKDFAPAALIALPPGLLVENPSVPAKTVKELIAFAKANPGKLNYGSAGTGAWNHLFFELFKIQAGVDVVHVPYKGTSPAVVDLLAGQVQLSMTPFPVALPHVRSGKLRLLAVTSAKRSQLLPEVPTITESGLPGYEAGGWFAGAGAGGYA